MNKKARLVGRLPSGAYDSLRANDWEGERVRELES